MYLICKHEIKLTDLKQQNLVSSNCIDSEKKYSNPNNLVIKTKIIETTILIYSHLLKVIKTDTNIKYQHYSSNDQRIT